MIDAQQTAITQDPSGKKLIVTREFNASLQQVWDAWTKTDLLDKWWAPKPWKAETKQLNFIDGGSWLYAMRGPKGECSWCKVDFKSIEEPNRFTATAYFCDEAGNVDSSFPPMHWDNNFSANGESMSLLTEITFENEAALNKIVGMGFKEGFTMGLNNLDDLLAGMQNA
ncbi:SRPBCC domain-containing protein [uncultured Mucilaginibacter sp.]|uniref:SRPBCC family protein n=1 Tax=uncultured Mucilaginibacter sp. TaxID=797541 RepID=UPI0025D76075|nr:SRPBCC domain-containing protein [uncultured Mucilaginibacter sp.]